MTGWTTILEDKIGALRTIRLTSEHLRLVVMPELGGKTISMVDAATHHEYLSLPAPNRPYRLPLYGASFAEYDISGWDECFPAIGESAHPDLPWQDVIVPDHGELWTLPWRAEAADGSLRMSVSGLHFPFHFQKVLTPREGGLRLDYSVDNLSPYPFACFWSTHPLLAATPTTRILIPTSGVLVELSISGRLGARLDRHPWPATVGRDGRPIELDVIGPPEQGEADKLYSDRLAEGWAALHDEQSGQWLLFTFDPLLVPFLGYWANRSGWPAWPPFSESYNLALEPCSGAPDRLDVAASRGACMTIAPKARLTWQLEVLIGRGFDRLRDAISDAGWEAPTG